MSRSNRFALPIAALLLLLLVGSVVARPGPGTPEEVAPPEADDPPAEDLAHARERLAANELTVDDAVLSDLAARYGVGGAVRLVAWADATGEDIEDLAAMRDGTAETPGMGWGQMARQLNVHPGIGSIMGQGGGHGPDGAPGRSKDRSESEDAP